MTGPKSSTKTSGTGAATKAAAATKTKAPATRKATPAKTVTTEKKPTVKMSDPKPTPKKAPAKPAVARAKKPKSVPAEQRRNYIEMAAYYIAERRGFAPGNPLEDWVQAEAEIDRLLAEGRLGG
ncbi:MAG: DUF2934 domain-containing protein [Sulfuritalea sp.]|nr:DUF2934 domain-containing protein [Sulfuritalea sp.]